MLELVKFFLLCFRIMTVFIYLSIYVMFTHVVLEFGG